MSVSLSTIRQAAATALAGVSGWSESPTLYDLWGTAEQGESHKTFAVKVGEFRPIAANGGRQRSAYFGTALLTARWAYNIALDAQVADYDTATDAAEDLAAAVHGMTTTGIATPQLIEPGIVHTLRTPSTTMPALYVETTCTWAVRILHPAT